MKLSTLPLWHVVVSIPGLNIDKYVLSEDEPTLEQIQAVWDADGGSATKLKPRGWVGPLSEAYPGVGLVERVNVVDLTPAEEPGSPVPDEAPEPTPEWDKFCRRVLDDPTRRLEHLHVEWGPEAVSRSREELCRALNDSMDRVESGRCVAGPPTSGVEPTDVRELVAGLSAGPTPAGVGSREVAVHVTVDTLADRTSTQVTIGSDVSFRAGFAAVRAARDAVQAELDAALDCPARDSTVPVSAGVAPPRPDLTQAQGVLRTRSRSSGRRSVSIQALVDLAHARVLTTITSRGGATADEVRGSIRAVSRCLLAEVYSTDEVLEDRSMLNTVDVLSDARTPGYDRDGVVETLEKFVADGTTLDEPRDLDVLVDALAESFRPGSGPTPW